MSLPRKLAFDDRFVYYLTQQINGDPCDSPVLFPDNTTPIKLVIEISQDEFTEVLSALMCGADLLYPDNAHQVVWNLLRNWECPVSICDEILECLQPAFDEINDKLDALSTQVSVVDSATSAINAVLGNNATSETPVAQSSIEDELCGGATGVVEAMDSVYRKAYASTEASWVDSVFEAIPEVISAIPFIGDLPLDEMFEFVDWLFEHQVEEYIDDFNTIKPNLITDLKCFVQAHGHEFTWDVWNEWLTYTGTNYPDNRAAQLFARTAPARQTWLNQIAALINKSGSLQSFFDQLGAAWGGGILNPVTCTGDCPEIGWSQQFGDGFSWGDFIIVNGDGDVPIGEFSGTGVQGTATAIAGNTAFGVFLYNSTPLPYVFQVTVNYDFVSGGGSPGQNHFSSAGFSGFPSLLQGTFITQSSGDIAASSGGVGIEFLSRYGVAPDGNVYIRSITISSSFGSNPY